MIDIKKRQSDLVIDNHVLHKVHVLNSKFWSIANDYMKLIWEFPSQKNITCN